MRRDAELLITTIAKTGRAPQQTPDLTVPPAAVAATKAPPEPLLVAPQHSTKNRKMSAEEQLFALAGETERPAPSAEGLFAKVAQMAQEAELAAPAPVHVDRPAPPPAAQHKRVDTPTVAKKGVKSEKKQKDEAQKALNKEKKLAGRPSLVRVDTPIPATLANAAAGATGGAFLGFDPLACIKEEAAIRERAREIFDVIIH